MCVWLSFQTEEAPLQRWD